MQITEEQKTLFRKLRCKRVKDIDRSLLSKVEGVKIDKEGHRSQLINHFRNVHHVKDDAEDKLASYVVLAPDDTILLFFSIRCGELFEKVDERKMQIGHNAWLALRFLSSGVTLTEEQRNKALGYLKDAQNEGMTLDDLFVFASKKHEYIEDVKKEPSKDVSRVSRVFSGAELKFYGANGSDKAIAYWKSLNMPRRMGESLFWWFIMDKFEKARQVTGCQYLYLFAADEKPDGDLVTYYRTLLSLNIPPSLSANKPHFDYESQFLYQDIATLLNKRDYFFEHFTPEPGDNNV